MSKKSDYVTQYDEKESDALNGPQDMLAGGAATDYSEIDAAITWPLSQLDPVGKTIKGTDRDDRLRGSVEDDTMYGLGGNDQLYGDNGNDTLYGDSGNDQVYGGAGEDWLFGDDGEDRLFGDEGNDQVYGGAGDNLLYGGGGNDRLFGGNTNDILYGNDGNDILYGNDGNDTLFGDGGMDTLRGGAGDDTYFVDDTGDIVTEGTGEDTDTVYSSITYTLTDNVENLYLIGSDNIIGRGNDLDNIINGNVGNDSLYGGAGNDSLYGGLGMDTLYGGAGNDALFGRYCDDTYYVDDAGDIITEYTDEGADTVISSITCTLGDNVENLTLTGDDAINGTGNDLNNNIYGNDADNALSGNEGNDTLDGSSGNDTLDGGSGADTMYGGSDNDTYYVDDAGDVITESPRPLLFEKGGTDTIYSSVTYTLGVNLENLTLTGTDAINGIGNDLNNIIIGNEADNVLFGLEGNDTLWGGTGNNVMYGNEGNDVLIGDSENELLCGDAGDDIMIGVGGNDTLMGGEGSDTYQFSIGYGSDIIDDTGAAGGTDMIKFNRLVDKDTIAFFQDKSDLHITYGDTDYITVLNQNTAGTEKVQATNGWYLTDADINTIIQQITAYTTEHGLSVTNANDVKNNQELMSIIVNSWRQ
jgi:Ca2+-binding RTX toxin-like protein